VRGARVRASVLWGLTALGGNFAACGNEAAPWNGFPLFPVVDASVPLGAGTYEPVVPTIANSDDALAPPSLSPRLAQSGSGGVAGSAIVNAGAPSMPVITAGAVAATSTAGSAGPAPVTVFRVTELYLRDPHLFIGVSDITEMPVLGVSINRTLIPNKLTMDADHDGFLDLSMLLQLQPLDPLSTTATLTLTEGHCAADPSGTKPCAPSTSAPLAAAWPITYSTTGTCLEPIAGSTSSYQPTIAVPQTPCFATSAGHDLVINLGGVAVQVSAARVSASQRLQPAPALVSGLISGFVSSTSAMRAILPADVGAPLAGSALSNYVRQQDYDLATSPTMENGFWLYLNFVAQRVDYAP
jgi:hypothetical protein